MGRRTVVIGLVGTKLDIGGKRRWDRWRPTVSLCQHEDLVVDRLELLASRSSGRLVAQLAQDIRRVSPETEVRPHRVEFDDPWDFAEVYGTLHDFARGYSFREDSEDYLVHMTTGTHVAQICLFLLTESRHFPARLIQSSPPIEEDSAGRYAVIDLDLSRYDRLAERFAAEKRSAVSFLKAGIETRNAAFNHLMEEIEVVALHSPEPLLLTGATGVGKTNLARRIYELKSQRRLVTGAFVEVNCATLRGDAAMSALFGHKKGAFTGAVSDRTGLLGTAHEGLLFLDEIANLGLDEQAMLLRALEEKTFLPVGSDQPVRSDFGLIAGTNENLDVAVAEGRFREDLLARLDTWSFRVPSLKDRREDLEPNLTYELSRWTERTGRRVSFNKEARRRFLEFAMAPDSPWHGNFRDLNAAVLRMATFAAGGRIQEAHVAAEIQRLKSRWQGRRPRSQSSARVEAVLGKDAGSDLDRFVAVQLEDVLAVCEEARSLSEAGRRLFAASREKKRSSNDADRLAKYLAKFDLTFSVVQERLRQHLATP